MSESSTPLNSDILISILSLSLPKAATSIMATCRFLYHEGAKVVLQQPVVLDGSEQRALSLLRFLQAENLSRCSYVRALQIFTDPVPESVAKILVDIVPRMSNLVRLWLRGEISFVVYPYLLPAFASLRSVKVLMIVDVGARSCEMIRTLQSELVIASILYQWAGQFGTGISPAQSFIASRHPLQLLQQSASTLQELMCGFWCDAYTETEALIPPPEIIYPEVRRLILSKNSALSPIPYIRALPNLTHLNAESHHDVLMEYGQLGISRTQRQKNLMVQSLIASNGNRLTEDGEPPVWKHIQSYTGPLSHLWALGIAFPIPRLFVTDAPGVRSPLALTEVLAYARPTHLTIAFEDQAFADALKSEVLSALRSVGASGVRSLGLMFDLMAGDVDGHVDVGQAMASIEAVLSTMQLCDIQFTLRDITPPESAPFPVPDGELRTHSHEHAHAGPALRDPLTHDLVQNAPSLEVHVPTSAQARAASGSSEAESPGEPFTLAERTLEDFDVRAFVSRLSTCSPTVQNTLVSVGRPRRCGGALRTGQCLGKHDDDVAEMHVYTEGKIVYRELAAPEVARTPEESDKLSWADLSRAWYLGLRGRDSRGRAT